MPTKLLSVGTTVQLALRATNHYETDFVIQNLSANNLYLGDIEDVATTNGIKILAGGFISKDKWHGDIWLIADGATSDVRFLYQTRLREDP